MDFDVLMPRRALTTEEIRLLRLLSKRAMLNEVRDNPARLGELFGEPPAGHHVAALLLTRVFAECRVNQTEAPLTSLDDLAKIGFPASHPSGPIVFRP